MFCITDNKEKQEINEQHNIHMKNKENKNNIKKVNNTILSLIRKKKNETPTHIFIYLPFSFFCLSYIDAIRLVCFFQCIKDTQKKNC